MIIRELRQDLEESCHDVLNDFAQTAVLDLAASSFSFLSSPPPPLFHPSSIPLFIGRCTDADEAYEKRPFRQKRRGRHSREEKAAYDDPDESRLHRPILPSLGHNLSRDTTQPRGNLRNDLQESESCVRILQGRDLSFVKISSRTRNAFNESVDEIREILIEGFNRIKKYLIIDL